MPGTTTFASIKYALAADETKAFPAEVSEPGAKTIDKYLEEHTLTFKTRAASYEAKSGELGVQTSSAKTTTLPLAATASQFIGVVAKCAEVKVTTSGGAFIIGKAELTAATEAAKVATVVLTEGMTAFFFSDGTNWELWGQIKPEQLYEIKKVTKAEWETGGFVLSTPRPVMIGGAWDPVGATARNVLEVEAKKLASTTGVPGGVFVPPGQKIKGAAAAGEVEVSFVLL